MLLIVGGRKCFGFQLLIVEQRVMVMILVDMVIIVVQNLMMASLSRIKTRVEGLFILFILYAPTVVSFFAHWQNYFLEFTLEEMDMGVKQYIINYVTICQQRINWIPLGRCDRRYEIFGICTTHYP